MSRTTKCAVASTTRMPVSQGIVMSFRQLKAGPRTPGCTSIAPFRRWVSPSLTLLASGLDDVPRIRIRPARMHPRESTSKISPLQRHCHGVPAPDAQRREAAVHVLLFHRVQQCDHDAISRAANRMAEGYGAPAAVEALPGDAELLPHVVARPAERLIVLDQIGHI